MLFLPIISVMEFLALLTNVKEIISFFEEFKNSVGLLFDTAHYKVNCIQ